MFVLSLNHNNTAMKTNRLFLLLIAAVAIMSSCTKQNYYGGDSITMSHYDYSITRGDWQVASGNNGGEFLLAKLSVPEITRNVVAYGTVTVSWEQRDEYGYAYWTPLPVSRAEALDLGTDKEFFYSTYLDYEWSAGSVYVYFTATDLFVENDKSLWPNFNLRVTILY